MFPPGDVDRLTAAIRAVVSDRALRRRMGELKPPEGGGLRLGTDH